MRTPGTGRPRVIAAVVGHRPGEHVARDLGRPVRVDDLGVRATPGAARRRCAASSASPLQIQRRTWPRPVGRRLGHRGGQARHDEQLGGRDLVDEARRGRAVAWRCPRRRSRCVAPATSAPSSSVVPSMKLIELLAIRTSSLSRDHASAAHVSRLARAPWVPTVALGPTGAAGGVDDRGRVVAVRPRRLRAARAVGRASTRHRRAASCDGSGRPSVMTDPRPGVVEHERDAGLRVLRVDGQIGRTGTQ